MEKKWSVFIEQYGKRESPFARVNPHIALAVVEKYVDELQSEHSLFPFRMREGLKRPLLRNFNRPTMERENVRLLETVARDLRGLIQETS